jgi:hypothetical protein
MRALISFATRLKEIHMNMPCHAPPRTPPHTDLVSADPRQSPAAAGRHNQLARHLDDRRLDERHKKDGHRWDGQVRGPLSVGDRPGRRAASTSDATGRRSAGRSR